MVGVHYFMYYKERRGKLGYSSVYALASYDDAVARFLKGWYFASLPPQSCILIFSMLPLHGNEKILKMFFFLLIGPICPTSPWLVLYHIWLNFLPSSDRCSSMR